MGKHNYIKGVRPTLLNKLEARGWRLDAKAKRQVEGRNTMDEGRTKENALFLNARGGRLGREGLAKIVNKAAKRAGLDKPVTPHVFRRSCATGMIRNKANPYYVKELLGHEHLDSLEPYLKLSIVDLKEVHKKCHPRERQLEAGG
ncbi:MAG: tyrosine-type recombinase/integrase [Chlamydiae bacterium]|nr:tyrosine-type recombinase/integrase [Chlamydiota bacterium]